MTERRYSDEEVELIFERAATAQQAVRRQLPAGEGMSLADLRSIGAEAGIPAELVEQAARSLDTQGREATRKFLGLPLGVGRTVELNRKLTDEDWERLVVDLRETFDARGTVRAEGSLKSWNNGNLQALLEPTATGQRLRMKTMMGAARGMMMMGIGVVAASAVVMVPTVLAGNLLEALAALGPMALVGAGLFTAGAARLPGWAATRRRQMEGIAARLVLEDPTSKPGPESDD